MISGDEAVRAAARRAEDALTIALQRVAVHGHRATLGARAAAERAERAARLRAGDEAAVVTRALRAAVRDATALHGDDVVVPLGTVRVRRHAEVTATVTAPLLLPVRRGCVRIVAGEEAIPTVVAVTAIVARAAAAGAPDGGSVVVVNPRRRVLPAALRASTSLCEVHDGRGLLTAVDRAGPGGRLIVLDHPHDLGLAGRRLVHAATTGHACRALLIHHAADAPDVDLEHRRLRVSRTGVPHPVGGLELWPARRGWRWSSHPRLRVDLPAAPADDARDGFALNGDGSTGAPIAAEPAPGGGSGPRTADAALEAFEGLLDRLADVAQDLDEALASARADERRALDDAAALRRRTLTAIAVEARAIDLLLRRVGGARSPPRVPPAAGRAMRTAALRGDPAAATDLAPLRAARAALARAVDPARRARDG
jgi:hypothetical protein